MTKFGYKLIAKTNTSLKKINIIKYFENLTVRLHVLYTFNTHVKFCINQMLFTIWSINLFCIILDYKTCNLNNWLMA